MIFIPESYIHLEQDIGMRISILFSSSLDYQTFSNKYKVPKGKFSISNRSYIFYINIYLQGQCVLFLE